MKHTVYRKHYGHSILGKDFKLNGKRSPYVSMVHPGDRFWWEFTIYSGRLLFKITGDLF